MLMELFVATLQREVNKLHQNGVRLRFIGDCSAFSTELQVKIAEAEELTRYNIGLNLVIAANYGGRWDICQAIQKIAGRVAAGEIKPEDITVEVVDSFLSTVDLPEPDLFIRTGEEQRISNFLLWQLAYTEFYFTPTLWPDFDGQSLATAIKDYMGRQRRFGHTSEQILGNAANS